MSAPVSAPVRIERGCPTPEELAVVATVLRLSAVSAEPAPAVPPRPRWTVQALNRIESWAAARGRSEGPWSG